MTATTVGAAEPRTRGVSNERDEQAPAGSRAQTFTVLSSLVVVQLAWFAALAYGAYSLLR